MIVLPRRARDRRSFSGCSVHAFCFVPSLSWQIVAFHRETPLTQKARRRFPRTQEDYSAALSDPNAARQARLARLEAAAAAAAESGASALAGAVGARRERVLRNLEALAGIDPAHAQQFSDLRSSHAIEGLGSVAAAEWSAAAAPCSLGDSSGGSGGGGQQLQVSFPYVCPEPVLVKRSFLYINGSKSRAGV